MMKKAFIVFLLFNAICFNYINGQVLSEKEEFSNKSFLKKNLRIEQVFEDEGGFYTLSLKNEDYKSGKEGFDRSFVLRTNRGDEIVFNSNERPIAVKKNKVYTAIYDVDDFKARFAVYELNDKQKKTTTKKPLELNLYSNASVLKTGDFIVTEGTENGGIDWVGLYSPALDLIHKFTPFKDESNVVFDANENYIAYAAQVLGTNIVRMALYGSFADKGFVGSQQFEVDKDHMVSSVAVEETTVTLLLSGPKGNQLLTFNKNLEVLHKRNLNRNISHHKLIGSQGKLFFSSGLKVMCYDIKSDTIDWEYEEEQFSSLKTKNGYRAKGGELFLLDDIHLVFAEGTYEDGVGIVKNTSLKVITCKEGEVVQKITTGDFIEKVQFIATQKEVALFGNNKMISYEKQ